MRRLISIVVFLVMASFPAYAEDMQKYLSDTETLVTAGKYKEALDRFMWFHNHALEHAPSMYGVRLSFALSYWKELADVYPPALTAMKKTRDDKTILIQQGKGNRELFHDVISLNETLGDNSNSVDLFRELDLTQKDFARQVWDIVKDAVIKEKAYDVAQNYIGNLLNEFTELKEFYYGIVPMYSGRHNDKSSLKETNENNFIEKTILLIDTAIAIGDIKSAQEIQRRALAILDNNRLRNAIPKEQEKNAQQKNRGDKD